MSTWTISQVKNFSKYAQGYAGKKYENKKINHSTYSRWDLRKTFKMILMGLRALENYIL